jgi:thiol-disulfide isomerase/thioredoxin
MRNKIIFLVMNLVISFITVAYAQVEGLEIGNKAPELIVIQPNGKTISLSSLKGKVVLIDFWASWCKPNRDENPNIVAAYSKFKNTKFLNFGNDFTVFSISLDKSKEAWTKAIKDDGLEWENHGCDFKVWSSDAAILYKSTSIPKNFLIDKDGIIIAKNLRGGSVLSDKLASLEFGARDVPSNTNSNNQPTASSSGSYNPSDNEKGAALILAVGAVVLGGAAILNATSSGSGTSSSGNYSSSSSSSNSSSGSCTYKLEEWNSNDSYAIYKIYKTDGNYCKSYKIGWEKSEYGNKYSIKERGIGGGDWGDYNADKKKVSFGIGGWEKETINNLNEALEFFVKNTSCCK